MTLTSFSNYFNGVWFYALKILKSFFKLNHTHQHSDFSGTPEVQLLFSVFFSYYLMLWKLHDATVKYSWQMFYLAIEQIRIWHSQWSFLKFSPLTNSFAVLDMVRQWPPDSIFLAPSLIPRTKAPRKWSVFITISNYKKQNGKQTEFNLRKKLLHVSKWRKMHRI